MIKKMKRGREQQLPSDESQREWPVVLRELVYKYGIESQYFYHLPTLFNWCATCLGHRYAASNQRMLYMLTQKKERLRHHGCGKLHIEWRRQFVQLENAINITLFFSCLATGRNILATNDIVDTRHVNIQFATNDALMEILGVSDLTSDYVVWLLTQCRTLFAIRLGLELTISGTTSDRGGGAKLLAFPWVSFAGLTLTISFRDSGLSSWDAGYRPVPNSTNAPTLPFDCLVALSECGIESRHFIDTAAYFNWFATCHRLRDWFLARHDHQFGLFKEKHTLCMRLPTRMCVWNY